MNGPETLLEDGSRLLSRKQTVRLVAKWIEERKPAAVVRFLEGEGRLLAADPADDLSMKVAMKKLRRQTGLTFSAREVLKVKSLVLKALDEADVLGIRPGRNFPDKHQAWMELIANVYADRVRHGRQPAYLAHCLIRHDLYEALPVLLKGQHRVSVASCRNIRPKLETHYGIPDVAVYQIPSQYVMRDVDDDYEARLHDVPIWPAFYRQLQSDIEVRERGEIFLIGAGLFGKELCIRVRELGGIALDMGSNLDQMVSKITRGESKPKHRPPPREPKVV
jgi:hypothetical protein